MIRKVDIKDNKTIETIDIVKIDDLDPSISQNLIVGAEKRIEIENNIIQVIGRKVIKASDLAFYGYTPLPGGQQKKCRITYQINKENNQTITDYHLPANNIALSGADILEFLVDEITTTEVERFTNNEFEAEVSIFNPEDSSAINVLFASNGIEASVQHATTPMIYHRREWVYIFNQTELLFPNETMLVKIKYNYHSGLMIIVDARQRKDGIVDDLNPANFENEWWLTGRTPI